MSASKGGHVMNPKPAIQGRVPADYASWLADIKRCVADARQRAALAVNAELILLYWRIGRDIPQRQSAQGWGSKVIERLARDLREAFPDKKGFSRAISNTCGLLPKRGRRCNLCSKLLHNCRGFIFVPCLTNSKPVRDGVGI
jgi:hypothetical protein